MFRLKSEYECIGLNEAINQKEKLVKYTGDDIEWNIVVP